MEARGNLNLDCQNVAPSQHLMTRSQSACEERVDNPGSQASNDRIASLDGLRALSILLVLTGHVTYATGFDSWFFDVYAHAGVLVFFVISGYLITTLMRREVASTGRLNIRQFYHRRVWRILPASYAYLAIVTLVQHAQFSWRDIGLSWGFLYSYASLFGNLQWNLAHLWSLSVEEQFYFVWPFAVALSLRKAECLAWASVLMAPVFRYWFLRHGLASMSSFSLPAVGDSVAVGCLLAIYRIQLQRLVSARWLWLAWPAASLLPALSGIGDGAHWLSPLAQLVRHCLWTVFNVLTGISILWAIRAKPRVLNHGLMVWIGALSYSLYLWQMPWMNQTIQMGAWERIALSFICAAASYYGLERPLLAMRNERKRGKAVKLYGIYDVSSAGQP